MILNLFLGAAGAGAEGAVRAPKAPWPPSGEMEKMQFSLTSVTLAVTTMLTCINRLHTVSYVPLVGSSPTTVHCTARMYSSIYQMLICVTKIITSSLTN